MGLFFLHVLGFFFFISRKVVAFIKKILLQPEQGALKRKNTTVEYHSAQTNLIKVSLLLEKKLLFYRVNISLTLSTLPNSK